MLNEEDLITPEVNEEINQALDKPLNLLVLSDNENKIIQDIIEAPTKEELQLQFELFNMNQSKKNALRMIKLNNLLDKVEDQVIERFDKRPDQISNRELIDYMTVVSNQIDRTQRLNTDTLNNEGSKIRITNQKNEVNINLGQELNRDEKERVVDAVTALLKQVKQQKSILNEDYVTVPVENEDINIVYDNDEILDNSTILNTEENEEQ